VTGEKYDSTTQPFIEVRASNDEDPLSTALLVAPLESGALIAVGVVDGEIDISALEPWARAARCATERLGSPGQDFEWTSIVAAPRVRIGGTEVSVDGESAFGPFRISSTGGPLHEVLPPLIPSLHSAAFGTCWPLLIEGRHSGYNWTAAGRAAAFDLHRLCGLLSVAFGSCLVVREAPFPLEGGVRKAPSRLPFDRWPDGIEPDGTEPKDVRTFPDWLSEAWTRMQVRPGLGHAVAAHHEGLRSFQEHPSLALVAFIASVEAISNMLFKEEKCETCAAHTHVTNRFRATLRLVLPDEKANQLGAAYSPRSRTVHQGRLHGSETSPGIFGFSWNDPLREFDWETVYLMATASRDLLRLALERGLPGQRTPFETAVHLEGEFKIW
jgi:hypothetical protein